jgi:glycine/D-amino acid oxidase-like deaminating enzyme
VDLKSGYPYWAVKNGLLHAFPPLRCDLRCDVVVLGGGVTGALIADELASNGHDVAVLEQRDIGWGSTAASTALLQYEIDTHMVDLAKRYGEDQAVLAYRACAEAITGLRSIAARVRDVDFAPMRSLYYASDDGDVESLRAEFELRERHGFAVEWIEGEAELADRFDVGAPAAILSKLAARVDPYRLAYRLLQRLRQRGAGVFDRTAVVSMTTHARGVILQTAQGAEVRARHVVMAGGYANELWLHERVAKNRSSYAFVTDPLDDAQLGPLRDTMIWESARPYLYLRSTGDGRLVVGGDDDGVDVPARRDRRVEAKAQKLVKKVAKVLPRLELRPTFSWAGTFAETDDGLPFFGAHPQRGPRVLFAMAYGGNGITYSAIGAGLLRAILEREPHPLAQLFSFQRLGLT